MTGEHGDAAIGLGARQRARGMLAGDQATLVVPGEPVRLVAGLAKGADPVVGAPTAQMIARHIAEQEIAVAAVPQRTLGEEAAADQPLQREAGHPPRL